MVTVEVLTAVRGTVALSERFTSAGWKLYTVPLLLSCTLISCACVDIFTLASSTRVFTSERGELHPVNSRQTTSAININLFNKYFLSCVYAFRLSPECVKKA
jgi:hypothetical protein